MMNDDDYWENEPRFMNLHICLLEYKQKPLDRSGWFCYSVYPFWRRQMMHSKTEADRASLYYKSFTLVYAQVS